MLLVLLLFISSTLVFSIFLFPPLSCSSLTSIRSAHLRKLFYPLSRCSIMPYMENRHLVNHNEIFSIAIMKDTMRRRPNHVSKQNLS
uniref:Secreted protein n=1 Tax=Parascaris univalens TaxID=6257 RepID=A0A915CCD5_PARUN